METKTLEQLFIAGYERLQKENEDLRAKLEDLQRPEIVCDDAPEKHPRAYRIDEPIEVATLRVVSSYNLGGKGGPLEGMDADEIREMASTRKGLEDTAQLTYSSYGTRYRLVTVAKEVYPMRVRSLGFTFAVEVMDRVHSGGTPYMRSIFVEGGGDLKAGSAYPVECAEALYERGLEILKERLLAYADELEAKAEKGAE